VGEEIGTVNKTEVILQSQKPFFVRNGAINVRHLLP
jgi:hypothetical protein